MYISNNFEKIYLKALDIDVISTVGAGDSLIAGFLAAYSMKKEINECLKLGLACATATVESMYLATKNEINKKLTLLK